MSSDRKESTVVVKIPDLGPVLKLVYEQSDKFDPRKKYEVKAVVRGTIGYVETPVGIYVLDDEGCGHLNPVSDEDAVIDFDYFIDKENYISIMPSGYFGLKVKELIDLPVKKEVLLHDFVRKFGSRLERNYEACRREFETCLV